MEYEKRVINSDQVRQQRYKDRFNHQREVYICAELELRQSETSKQAFDLLAVQNRAERIAAHIVQDMHQIGMDLDEVFKKNSCN